MVSEKEEWESDHCIKTITERAFQCVFTYGFLIEFIPAEVDVSVSEVTNEFVSGSGNRLHEGALEDSNEGDHLDKSSGRDAVRSEKSGNTVREGVERVSGVVDGSRKVDSGTGGDLTQEGQHTNTSVLDFDESKTFETVFVLSCS